MIRTIVEQEMLEMELLKLGKLSSLFYVPDLEQESRGWAFVTFSEREDGLAAVEAINGVPYFEVRTSTRQSMLPNALISTYHDMHFTVCVGINGAMHGFGSHPFKSAGICENDMPTVYRTFDFAAILAAVQNI